MMLRLRVVINVLALLLLAGLLYGQRADRATITGFVNDPSGNSIPGATVKIRSDDTNVETVLTTNDAGAYTSPLLVLGVYTVQVEQSGFKTGIRSGIRLLGGQTYRVDVPSRTRHGDRKGGSVGGCRDGEHRAAGRGPHGRRHYYRDLPVVMGADIRLAEALLQLQPGYTPMRPNGDPMFRGSQFGSRINGGQSFATENFFDGVAFGYASGHQDSHESAPPIESVGEMRVIESAYSAQYGHTSGGTVEYTSKAGNQGVSRQRIRVLCERRIERPRLLSRPRFQRTQQQLRIHPRRTGDHSEGLQRPQQDLLLHQSGLVEVSVPARCPDSATRRRSMPSKGRLQRAC